MNFLLTPYVAALVLYIAELRGRLTRDRLSLPLPSPPALVAILMASYAAQLGILRVVATSTARYHAIAQDGWVMPLPVIFPNFPHAGPLCAAFLSLGALQSAALVALYRLPVSRTLLWSGCALNLAISVAAPVLGSFDLYGYVQNAMLGRGAYSPPSVPFPGEYHIIDLWFGEPTTTLYGPLWIPIVQMVMGLAPTLVTKMLAFRAFSAALFLALLAMLAGNGQPRRVLAVIAVNPAMAFLTVANAHNDLLALAILAAAAALVRRFPVLAVAAIALAGLIKLPYALLGLPILSAVRSSVLRWTGAVAAVAAAVGFSWLGAGPAYFRALQRHAGALDAGEVVRAAIILFAIVAIVSAVARRPRRVTAVWLMPSLGAFRVALMFPWYALFAFPYALGRRRVLRYLMVSLPFVTALITPEMMQTWSFAFAIPLAVILSLRLPGKAPERA